MDKVYGIGLKCKCGEYVAFDIVPRVAADIVEAAPSASANNARVAIALLDEMSSRVSNSSDCFCAGEFIDIVLRWRNATAPVA